MAKLGERFGVVDKPVLRKVHKKPVPRIGGVAIFIAFAVPFAISQFCWISPAGGSCPIPFNTWLWAGAILVFLIGLIDDIHRVSATIKLGVQMIAASFAVFGGLNLTAIAMPWDYSLSLGWFSFPVTIFWFLLVINAINLIDGLDGLAAGVTFFASIVLLVLSIASGNYTVAAGLAALAGACLGFLKYNFNPASVFMGDAGSYFLGYMIAALSVMGSIKSQAAVAMLIPVVALGLPLMDTILAPIRRFVMGLDMFQPDKGHIHHKLLKMGYTHRRAVLVMYGATVIFGGFALLLVNLRDAKAGFLLMLLALCVVFAFRKLGYLNYLTVGKMVDYLGDVGDDLGFNKDRRTFLNRQVAISESTDGEQLWRHIVEALELLKMDSAEMDFNGACSLFPEGFACKYKWSADEHLPDTGDGHYRVLTLTLPLADRDRSYGVLILTKDLVSDPISHYTLRRIEHLRRSIVGKLSEFETARRIPTAFNGRPSLRVE